MIDIIKYIYMIDKEIIKEGIGEIPRLNDEVLCKWIWLI